MIRLGGSTRGGRVLVALSASLLVTSGGTIAAMLAVSLVVYERTGSNFWASSVFASQWVLPLVGLPLLMRWCSRRSTRNLLVASESTALFCTLAVPWLLDSAAAPLVVAVLLLRGFLEALTKSAATVALKLSVPQESLARANTTLEISRYVGYSAGAAIAARYLENASLEAVVLIDAATFALSVLFIALAGLGVRHPAGSSGVAADYRWLSGLRLLHARPRVWPVFWLLGLATVFQGIHYVARTALPIEVLHEGADAVGLLTSLSTLSILVGSLAAVRLATAGRTKQIPDRWWLAAPAAALCFSVALPVTPVSFASYCTFLALFEVAYVVFNNRLVVESAHEEAGVIIALRGAVMPAVMLVTVGLTGLFTDAFGLGPTAYATAGLVFAAGVAMAHAGRKNARRNMEIPDRPEAT